MQKAPGMHCYDFLMPTCVLQKFSRGDSFMVEPPVVGRGLGLLGGDRARGLLIKRRAKSEELCLGGCQGACPLIGAGVGRGGSRDRRRLRSSGAQRISRSLALSPLSFFFVASLRDDLARLERTTIRLLSQRHLVFVVNSRWVPPQPVFSSAAERNPGGSRP